MQQRAARFIAHAEASTGAEVPRFIKDDFDALQERGILAQGFLRLRCGECCRDEPLAFSYNRRGYCPNCGERRGNRDLIAGCIAQLRRERAGKPNRCSPQLAQMQHLRIHGLMASVILSFYASCDCFRMETPPPAAGPQVSIRAGSRCSGGPASVGP